MTESSEHESSSRPQLLRAARSSQRYNARGQRLVAGIVPLTEDQNHVLLVRAARKPGWILPKGGWESDESCEQAATREAWEEAGIAVRIDYTLGTIDRKRPGKAVHKRATVYYFHQATVLEQYQEWPEVHKRERKWFVYEDAMEMLSDRPELQEALEKSTIMRLNRERTQTLERQSQDKKRRAGGEVDPSDSDNQRDQVTSQHSQDSGKSENAAKSELQVKSESHDATGQIDPPEVALHSLGVGPGEDSIISSGSDLGKKSTLPLMPRGSLEAEPLEETGTDSQDTRHSLDASSSSPPSSDDTTRDIDPLSREGLKAAVLNRLMRHFYKMISSQPTPQEATGGSVDSSHGAEPSLLTNDSSNSVGGSFVSDEAYGSTQQGSSLRSRDTQRKRPAGDDDDANDGEDDRAGRSPKQPRANEPRDKILAQLVKRLACPYYKNDPMREHPARSCLGPGWIYVHRLKEHLYRCHAQPINCPRCHQIFDTDQAKDEHTAADIRCEAQTRGAPLEGFNSTQEKLLRSKKKAHKQMTEEEKWIEVYLILFRIWIQRISLPRLDYEYGDLEQGQSGSSGSELSRYEAFLRRELPSRVRQQLEVRIDEAVNPIEESLRAQLVEIVRDMQLELFTIYKSLRTRDTDSARTVINSGGDGGASVQEPCETGKRAETSTTVNQVANSGLGTRVEASAAGSNWDWDLTIEQQLALLSPIPPVTGEDLDHFNGLLFDFE